MTSSQGDNRTEPNMGVTGALRVQQALTDHQFSGIPNWKVALAEAHAERDRYRTALEEIARMPTIQRNPDGDDQAAHTMQMIARDALDLLGGCA